LQAAVVVWGGSEIEVGENAEAAILKVSVGEFSSELED
jgi:hypothetical protein